MPDTSEHAGPQSDPPHPNLKALGTQSLSTVCSELLRQPNLTHPKLLEAILTLMPLSVNSNVSLQKH